YSHIEAQYEPVTASRLHYKPYKERQVWATSAGSDLVLISPPYNQPQLLDRFEHFRRDSEGFAGDRTK
ncbi:hypothetical protein, partial [Sinorhizobium sp. BJ1]|uniref:hypothetical protein n=1 Tax=Sinorhizobium sp. BJ1 TaxID=2035455 RepID=UPI000BEBC0DC